MLRVGVDGVTKEDELNQRDADHHAEGEPVAPHLDEFLHHDGPEPPPVEREPFHDSASAGKMTNDECFRVEHASRLLNPASRRIWATGKSDGAIPLLWVSTPARSFGRDARNDRRD